MTIYSGKETDKGPKGGDQQDTQEGGREGK